jgi:hypothetical protein
MPSQEVCAANTVTRYHGHKACVSSCTFIPEVEPKMMICAIEDGADLANVKPNESLLIGVSVQNYTWCSILRIYLLI